MWGIRQFCFAIMILLLNTLFSNLSILIFGAFKVGIRYSVIFPDLNDLLQSYKYIHKSHLYNIIKSDGCQTDTTLFFYSVVLILTYDIIFKDGHPCHCRTKKDVRSCIIEYCKERDD